MILCRFALLSRAIMVIFLRRTSVITVARHNHIIQALTPRSPTLLLHQHPFPYSDRFAHTEIHILSTGYTQYPCRVPWRRAYNMIYVIRERNIPRSRASAIHSSHSQHFHYSTSLLRVPAFTLVCSSLLRVPAFKLHALAAHLTVAAESQPFLALLYESRPPLPL